MGKIHPCSQQGAASRCPCTSPNRTELRQISIYIPQKTTKSYTLQSLRPIYHRLDFGPVERFLVPRTARFDHSVSPPSLSITRSTNGSYTACPPFTIRNPAAPAYRICHGPILSLTPTHLPNRQSRLSRAEGSDPPPCGCLNYAALVSLASFEVVSPPLPAGTLPTTPSSLLGPASWMCAAATPRYGTAVSRLS